MAAPPFYLPLLLAFVLLRTAAADCHHLHLEHHRHGPHHHHHHRSPSATARLDTAPSMHQNRMQSESEESHQSLRVLNPFFTTAPSGEEAMGAMGAAAAAGDTTPLDLPSPPPPLPAAGDVMSPSLAPPQPQAVEAGSSESEAAAPPSVVDEHYRDVASTPPPPPVVEEPYRGAAIPPPPPPPVVEEPYRDAASPPPSVHDAARAVSSGTGDDLGLQQIANANVLASLGYNEMASSATLPSCIGDQHARHHYRRRHHHYRIARSAAASDVRIMIREAMSRLRGSGFGFVALAMRVKFGELEKLTNMTVFALDDHAIYSGGGHGYVSLVSFHIVPGHRLNRTDLLHLHSGTVLPTLAGEDQILVITHGAGSATDEIRINNIPVKEPDVAINSRVAVHGICTPFPRANRLLTSRPGGSIGLPVPCDSSVLATQLVQFCAGPMGHPTALCCNASR